MNPIRERIEADLKAAMKAGEKLKVSTLRMVNAALKNERIDRGRDLEEDEVIGVVAKAQKQRREAEEQYREGGRDELAEKEASEAEILQAYLPDPLPEEELDELIEGAIAETGATGMKDMGAVMGRVMAEARGRVEGAEVSRRVKARLKG